MSGGRRPRRVGAVDKSSKEVEELLSAAQDQMLLDISIGSHTTRSCPLDSDLAHRFEALKAPSSSAGISSAPLQAPVKKEGERSVAADAEVDEELKGILGADLSARFAALKGTSSSSKESQSHPQKLGDEEADVVVGDDGVSKNEVDKVMQWAMDAARLDPSVSSDDEDNDNDDDSEDEDVKKGQSKKSNGKRAILKTSKSY